MKTARTAFLRILGGLFDDCVLLTAASAHTQAGHFHLDFRSASISGQGTCNFAAPTIKA